MAIGPFGGIDPNVVVGTGSGGVPIGWVRPGTAPAVVDPVVVPVITGFDPKELAAASYGKVISIFFGGLARIGGVITVGPYFNGSLATFGISFGFAGNPEGTRELREISLDSKVVWTLASGFGGGTAFTFEFKQGTYTQTANAVETTKWGDNAVAYRPQMMIFFTDLDLTPWNMKIPYVAALIGDTTDGADPEDGINLGEAIERLAYSPWVQMTPDTFEAIGITDIIGAMIIAEDKSFLEFLKDFSQVYRQLDIIQTDKLRVIDRGADVTPDITLDRDSIVGAVQFVRQGPSSVPRELELITIDPDADYMMLPSTARRPYEPVSVAGSQGKKSMSLPIAIDAETRAALVTHIKFSEERSRTHATLTTTAFGMQVEPGDLVAIDESVMDGIPYEVFKCINTSHGGDYSVEMTLESMLRCEIGPHVESAAVFVNIHEAAGDFGSSTYNDVSIGAAAADRVVVIFAGSVNSTGFVVPRSLTSLTIDGAAMTIADEVQSGTFSSSTHTVAVAYKTVAAGTTADIVATWSLGSPLHFIAIYTLRGLASLTPFDVETNTVVAGNPTLSVNVPTDGALVAFYVGTGGTPAGVAWTGATVNADQALTIGPGARVSGADVAGLPAQSGRAVVATSTTGGVESAIAITFG